eukprot:gene7012-7226_t
MSPAASENPLASLLGYSDDESGGGEDSPRVAPAQKAQPARPLAASPDSGAAQAAGGEDLMNAELASFMQELESSGLLADTDAADTTDATDAAVMSQQQAASAAADSTGAVMEPSNSLQEPHNSDTQAATAPPTDDPATQAQAVPDQTDQQAEQRTLGLLAGAVEWAKVLDTGSGSIYYWHTVSNEVLWDPPAGVDGNALVPVEGCQQPDDLQGQQEAADAGAAQPQQVEAGAGPDGAATMDPLPAAEAATSDQQERHKEEEEQQQQQQSGHLGPGSPQGLHEVTPLIAEEEAAACQPSNSAAASQTAAAQQDEEPQSADAAMRPALEEVDDPAAGPAAVAASPPSQPTTTPQSDVHTVFMTLLTELQSPPAVQQALRQLPEAVKLVLQLQLLHQQWQTLAGQQQAAAANGQQKQLQDEEAEEGEVAGSADSEGEDMELDITPRSTALSQLQADGQPQLGKHAAGAAMDRGSHWGWPAGRAYTAAGTYTSTMHMPEWAQPRYHYEFQAARSKAGYSDYMLYAGYDTAGYTAAAYGMDRVHPAAAGPGYAPAACYVGYVDAATAGSDAAGLTPPLPEEAPPPLPDEPLPAEDVEQAPPLPDSSTQVADAVGVQPAGSAAKRKQYVSQPVITSVADGSRNEHADPQLQGADGAISEAVGAVSAGATMSVASAAAAAAAAAEAAGRKRSREKEGRGAALATAPAAKIAKAAKVSKLISKWASVRQQQEEEELERQRKEQEAADPDVQEQKRLQQLEHWRLQQLQSGAADSNPNFVPLAGDWRAKLGLGSAADQGAGGTGNAATGQGAAAEAARRAAKKAAKAAKAAKASKTAKAEVAIAKAAQWPTNSKTKPDLVALSVGLPSGWQAMWDVKSGDIYYGNPTTKVGMQFAAVLGSPGSPGRHTQVSLEQSGAGRSLMMRGSAGGHHASAGVIVGLCVLLPHLLSEA